MRSEEEGGGGERREEISRLEKVTFISQPCSFLPVFPREIPTDRYGFIRIDLSFVLIVARTRSIARFRSSGPAPTVGFTFATKFVMCIYTYIHRGTIDARCS